jgi:hypothetical protein
MMTTTARACLLLMFGLMLAPAGCNGAGGGGPDAGVDTNAADRLDEGAGDRAAGDAPPDLRPGDDAADAPAPADAAPEVPSSCPAEIASCAQAFLVLKGQCPGAGVACTQQTIGVDMINRCYANGVRVYFDRGATTVLRPDGRVCYRVENLSNGQLIDAIIKDPQGNEVLRITHTLGQTTEYFTCGLDFVDIPEGQRPCGDLDSLPPAFQCEETGTCERP